jgi:hypothetical protein
LQLRADVCLSYIRTGAPVAIHGHGSWSDFYLLWSSENSVLCNFTVYGKHIDVVRSVLHHIMRYQTLKSRTDWNYLVLIKAPMPGEKMVYFLELHRHSRSIENPRRMINAEVGFEDLTAVNGCSKIWGCLPTFSERMPLSSGPKSKLSKKHAEIPITVREFMRI